MDTIRDQIGIGHLLLLRWRLKLSRIVVQILLDGKL